ncbi:uncharacterized protein P884DRAFT_261220 [Thermothelomyces heterothallicus CBS 202.75]|uniref:uncharacterized protein n=1 Tax=Thermothelomyces heterothallicus CBS 202.75 TaxID=1149848 RepID=UPI0037435027
MMSEQQSQGRKGEDTGKSFSLGSGGLLLLCRRRGLGLLLGLLGLLSLFGIILRFLLDRYHLLLRLLRGGFDFCDNALFLGCFILGHTDRFGALGLLLGRCLAGDGGRGVDDWDNARLGIARLRPCLASHICVRTSSREW